MNPKLAWTLAIISAFIFFLLLTLVIYYLVSTSDDDEEPTTNVVAAQKHSRSFSRSAVKVLHPKHKKKKPTMIKRKKPKH